MLGGEKNLKDTNSNPLGIAIKDKTTPISYTKTSKLVAALYMVTDIMDKEEPLRNKLRTTGTNIISDIYLIPINALPKILEIMSFLDIALVVNLISEMNAGILRNEFFELKKAIEESIQLPQSSFSDVNLADLFKSDFSLPSASLMNTKKDIESYGGPTRIGVQKGSTLMKALRGFSMSDRSMSDRKAMSDTTKSNTNQDFELIKKERQSQIITIIKDSQSGATITDIRTRATGSLLACGEKTLQRELVGMVKNGVLKKTGEKRWSRYFLA